MYRILFICHGNICRSPMAQFVMQDLVERAGCAERFVIDSAATTNEEVGHSPHQGTVDKLKQVGVPVLHHRARKVRVEEYDNWDLIVCMDAENERHLERIFGCDSDNKIVRLMAFAPGAGLIGEDGRAVAGSHDAATIAAANKQAAEVADPWFTGNFEDTYRDVSAGCKGLLAWCQAH